MQSLSTLPNIQLKTDIIQQLFKHLRTTDVISYAFVDQFWRNQWRIYVRSLSVPCLVLQSHENSACLLIWDDVTDDNANCEKSRLFRGDLSSNYDRISILRQLFRISFTCKELKHLNIDTRNRSIDEVFATIAIEKEFHCNSREEKDKIIIDQLSISADQIFLLRWFACKQLVIGRANVAYPLGNLELLSGINSIVLNKPAEDLFNNFFFERINCQCFSAKVTMNDDNRSIIFGKIQRFVKEWQDNRRSIQWFSFDLINNDATEEYVIEAAHEFLQKINNCQPYPPTRAMYPYLISYFAKRDDDEDVLGIRFRHSYIRISTSPLVLQLQMAIRLHIEEFEEETA